MRIHKLKNWNRNRMKSKIEGHRGWDEAHPNWFIIFIYLLQKSCVKECMMIDRFQTPGKSLRFPSFSMVFPHQLCTTYLVQFRLDRHCARWHSGHDGHFNPPNQQLHDCGDLDSQRCCWSFAQRFLQPRVSWFHCLRFLPVHWDLLDVLDGVNHVWCERAELGFHQHHEALDLPGIGGDIGDMGDIDSQWITVVLLCIIAANLSNHEKSWLHVVKCTQMYLDSHMVHWPSWKACICRVPSSWACAALSGSSREPSRIQPRLHEAVTMGDWLSMLKAFRCFSDESPWCFPTETGQRIRGSCRYSPFVFWMWWGGAKWPQRIVSHPWDFAILWHW